MNENVGIIQVGNIYPDTPTFQNRTMGRVYSPEGICPTLNTTGGGDRVPLIVEMNENLGITKINMPDGLVGINGKKPIRPEDILPYLPSEDCVFDSRHWVAGSVEGGGIPIRGHNEDIGKLSAIPQGKREMYIKQATETGYIYVKEGGVFDSAFP